jgi:hypothetical protein
MAYDDTMESQPNDPTDPELTNDSGHSGGEAAARPKEPRDSRLEAYLREAAGILSSQRQWSAETQIKLQALARQMRLPPELFERALAALADPQHAAPPTRWEKAYEQYLRKQFERLPGKILSLPKERKALAYGQQKFQLAPDVCERSIARVAEHCGVARISDSQAFAHAQAEVARLVAASRGPHDNLRDQVVHLSHRWGVQPEQASRLLDLESQRVRRRRHRVWLRNLSLQVGVLLLSVLLILSIIWLGRILSPTLSGDVPELQNPENKKNSITDPGKSPRSVSRLAWWSNASQTWLESLPNDPTAADWRRRLAAPSAEQRGRAYADLWRWLDQQERLAMAREWHQPPSQLGSEPANPTAPSIQTTRWLRHPEAQQALLDWFFLEPAPEAASAWLEGVQSLRDSSSQPDTNQRSLDTAEAGFADFLIEVAADNILWRALNDSPTPKAAADSPREATAEAVSSPTVSTEAETTETETETALPETSEAATPAATFHRFERQNWLRSHVLGRQSERVEPPANGPVPESLRIDWLAEKLERWSLKMQSLPMPAFAEGESEHVSPASTAPLCRPVVMEVAQLLRQSSEAGERDRMLLEFWARVAPQDTDLAANAWPEVESLIKQVPQASWAPLLESWYLTPIDSIWHKTLTERWQLELQSREKTWSGWAEWDLLQVQACLGCLTLPDPFQLKLRQRLVARWLRHAQSRLQVPSTELTVDDWQSIAQSVQLALLQQTATDLASFDAVALRRAPEQRSAKDGQTPRLYMEVGPTQAALDRLRQARLNAGLDVYRAAIDVWLQQVNSSALIPWSAADQWSQELTSDLSAEQVASWREALAMQFAGPPPAQQADMVGPLGGAGLRPAVDRLLEVQPTLAYVWADRLEQDPTFGQRLQRHLFLAGPTTDAGGQPASDFPLKPTALRAKALTDWLKRQAESPQTPVDRVARIWGPIVQERWQSLQRPALPTIPWSEAEPLSRILLDHETQCFLIVKRSTPDTLVWLDNYRQTLDQSWDPLEQLRLAELNLVNWLYSKIQESQHD